MSSQENRHSTGFEPGAHSPGEREKKERKKKKERERERERERGRDQDKLAVRLWGPRERWIEIDREREGTVALFMCSVNF